MAEQLDYNDGLERLREIADSVAQRVMDQRPNANVTLVLLLLLVRIGNTWRTVRFLMQDTPKHALDVVSIDVGALLRVMFDAYFQANYLVHDPTKSDALAQMFLDYEHVERYNRVNRTLQHDNAFTAQLRVSPHRGAGEQRNQEAFDRVKDQFLKEGMRKDGTRFRGPRTRDKWYPGDLYRLAVLANKEDEYDTFVSPLSGCIHSSVVTLRRGPPITNDFLLHLASTLLARAALLVVDQAKLDMGENRLILQPFAMKLWDAG